MSKKVKAFQWTNGGEEVLVLRCIAKDGKSYRGFQNPLIVGESVTAPDWNTKGEYGGGIHGWPWGLVMGDGKDPDWSALWQVYGVDPKKIVDLEGKCKFQTGVLKFSGGWQEATNFVLAGQIAWVQYFSSGAASATGYSGAASATGYSGAASATGYSGAASATGYSGAASATGYSGAASATGDRGAASATGDRGAASATGDRGAASATGYSGAASATGYSGAASATGYRGAASATGDRGAASATGYRGAASATGYRGAASATGYNGAASATGYRGAASATGYSGAASATGYSGAASATGYRGAASATGDSGAASAKCSAVVTGLAGKAMANEFGCIALAWWNKKAERLEMRCALVGTGRGKLKPDTWYALNAKGEFVIAK